MPSTGPRLLVVDQSLKDYGGHHYEYDLAVSGAAARLGISAVLAAHRAFPEQAVGNAPVVGHFSGAWDEARRTPARAALHRVFASLPEALRHPLLRAASVAGRKSRAASIVANHRFGAELADIIATLALNEHDHVLVHTLSDSELLGVFAVFGSPPSPHLHLVLRYDGSPASAQAFAVARRNAHLLRRVHLWTDTEQLAEHYRELGSPHIGVLPIPHCLPEPLPDGIRNSSEPLTLAFLGGARGDKGFHLLPGLVEAMDHYLVEGRA